MMIAEMKIFVKPDCKACENVLGVVDKMYNDGLVNKLIIINRKDEPEECPKYNVLVYPAVYIDDELIFYGEFTINDAMKYAKEASKFKNVLK